MIISAKKKLDFSRARDRSDHLQKHLFLNNRSATHYYLIKILIKLLLSIKKKALDFETNNTSYCCAYVKFVVLGWF